MPGAGQGIGETCARSAGPPTAAVNSRSGEIPDPERGVFHTAYDELAIGIGLFDLSGGLVNANTAWLEVFDVPDIASMKGCSLFDDFSVSDEARERLRSEGRAAFETSCDLDNVKQRRGWKTERSGLLYLDMKIVVTARETGTRTGYLVQISDISERRQTADRLRLLKEAIEVLPIGITIIDTGGRIVYTNASEAEIHGYTTGELTGRDSRSMAPRELWKPIAFEQLHAMGVWKRESVNIRKDGSAFPVQLTSIAVKNPLGVPIGIITACEDITERKRVEEKLKQRQEALHSVYKIATTPGASFQSVCNDVVASLASILKASHVVVLRRAEGPVIRFIAAIADGAIQRLDEKICTGYCPCVAVYDTGKSSQSLGALSDMCPNHTFSQAGINCLLSVPVVDTKNAVIGAINIMERDQRVFTDDEVRQSEIFARYIAFVVERDAMEERLMNARKMEVIGKLASGVAHEVRNPLNAIMAISEALARDLGENPEYRPFLEHIRTQVDRLSTLMRDLLDLGKPAEQLQLQRESLRDLCSSSLDIWKHTGFGTSHQASILWPLAAGDIFIPADSGRIQQVFLNLLENAAQHSPAGSEIRIVVHPPERNNVRISVVDSGAGVPADVLPRIFEPFFSTRKAGAGLGMSIVKHIVESHGGTIGIRNNDPPPGCAVEMEFHVAAQEAQ